MSIISTLGSIAVIPTSALAGYLYEINVTLPFFGTILIEAVTLLIIILYIKEPKEREL
jgi:hypothetical protein